ncbi:MAG TPA: hypothetical protein H9830_02250, partial [Candidatus Agrococcus pullicola]|nr:hypothetical protein [Candidatus Agrococcus pullicola]
MSDITLPELGESVTEGTITRWLKQVGDTVEVDEPIVEISTDKVDTEIPSPVAGTLTEILADEDDEVEVGAVIARVGEPSEGSDQDESAPAESADTAEASEAEKPEAEESEAEVSEAEEVAEEVEQEQSGTDEQAEEPAADSSASSSGSATDVTLPELGESVTEGTITRWLKQVGDTVEVDEPIVEIS